MSCPKCKSLQYKMVRMFRHLKTIRVMCGACQNKYYLDVVDESGWKQQKLMGGDEDGTEKFYKERYTREEEDDHK